VLFFQNTFESPSIQQLPRNDLGDEHEEHAGNQWREINHPQARHELPDWSQYWLCDLVNDGVERIAGVDPGPREDNPDEDCNQQDVGEDGYEQAQGFYG